MKSMATAYVLINADVGKENDVLRELKKVPSVKEAYFVYGVYDIVAKVETNDVRELKEVVVTKIRRLDYVRSTLTMIVMEGR
jgi:DNA-binding Lrp family transcriptional regulator